MPGFGNCLRKTLTWRGRLADPIRPAAYRVLRAKLADLSALEPVSLGLLGSAAPRFFVTVTKPRSITKHIKRAAFQAALWFEFEKLSE